MLRPLTKEEIRWTQAQPVIGTPSLTRLRARLKKAGYPPIRIALAVEGDGIRFEVWRGAKVLRLDREGSLRLLITTFRASGFEVGFTELGISDMDEMFILGSTLAGPIDQICEEGPPDIEP